MTRPTITEYPGRTLPTYGILNDAQVVQDLIDQHNEHATAIDALESGGSGGSVVGFLRPESYGAVGDGVTDDRAAIKACMQACAALGGMAYMRLDAKTYVVGREGSTSWSLDVPGNSITIVGTPGLTWLKHPAGMPNASVCIMRVNERADVTITGVGFDGNWGNPTTTIAAASNNTPSDSVTYTVASTTGFPSSGSFTVVDNRTGGEVITYTGKTSTTFTGCTGGSTTALLTGQTVGYVDSNTGINHTTQVDPKNYGLMIRGCQRTRVDNCRFQQNYGDMIWIGHGATTNVRANGTKIVDCYGSIAARNGVTFGGGSDNTSIEDSYFMSCYSQAFDTESGGDNHPVRNVSARHCVFDSWWNRANHIATSPMSIVTSVTGHPAESNNARMYHIEDCTITGPVIIEGVCDVAFVHNRVICDWTTNATAPIFVQFACGDLWIEDNYVYDSPSSPGSSHEGAIAVLAQAAGNQPSSFTIRRNRIHSKNGNNGVFVHGQGGRPGDTGTASGVDATSLTDGGKSWTTNAYVGNLVMMGGVLGLITANTGTVLTVQEWMDPQGSPAATPGAGAYTIQSSGTYAEVSKNFIDCTDDGSGAGGWGVGVKTDAPGMRLIIEGNEIRNATTDAINVNGPGSSTNTIRHLKIVDNIAYDDQVTPTCTSVVRFQKANLNYITLTEMRENTGVNVANQMSGLTSGQWLVSSGDFQTYTGFGTPEGAITAPPGSIYMQRDGDASSTFYFKTGSTSTGWTLTTTPSPQAPEYITDNGWIGSNVNLDNLSTAGATMANGVVYLMKCKVYGTTITNVLVETTGTAAAGATAIYVGLYKSDGTQTGAMSTCTIDAKAAFEAAVGLKKIVLTNTVSVSSGDVVYVAILPVGCSTQPAIRQCANGNGNGTLGAADGFRTGSSGSGLTALPGSITISGMSGIGNLKWVGLS